MNSHTQKLLKIQGKIFQVLRIKKQLEARRQYYITQLSNSFDTKEALGYLSSLIEIYRREERVIRICEKGLVESLKILKEVEAVVNNIESLPLRFKSNLKSMIPIIGKKDSSPQSIIPLLKVLYSYLEAQIVYIDKNLDIIRENITEQHKNVIILYEKIESRTIDKKISQTKYFQGIEGLRKEEIKIIENITKESNSMKGKMVKAIININIKLSRNQKLLKFQAVVQFTPIVTPGTAAIGIFLGPQFVPVAYALLTIVNWSPTIVIAVKESTILLENPAKRMKSLATLSLKAAKLGLTNQSGRIRKTMAELTRQPMKPVYAR